MKSMFFIIVAVKIGLYTKYRAEKISWTLGDTCASKNNLTVEANGFHEAECALAIGHAYTLKCKSSVGQGWNSTFIIIENVAYCEHFNSGFEETAFIIIRGTHFLNEFYAFSVNRVRRQDYLRWTLHDIGPQTTQCPLDLPYAFNNGNDCCHYDEDDDGKSLLFTSYSCKNNIQIPCRSGRCVSNGEWVKWLI